MATTTKTTDLTVDDCRTATRLYIADGTLKLCAYHEQVRREAGRLPDARAGILTPGAICEDCFARLYDEEVR